MGIQVWSIHGLVVAWTLALVADPVYDSYHCLIDLCIPLHFVDCVTSITCPVQPKSISLTAGNSKQLPSVHQWGLGLL